MHGFEDEDPIHSCHVDILKLNGWTRRTIEPADMATDKTLYIVRSRQFFNKWCVTPDIDDPMGPMSSRRFSMPQCRYQPTRPFLLASWCSPPWWLASLASPMEYVPTGAIRAMSPTMTIRDFLALLRSLAFLFTAPQTRHRPSWYDLSQTTPHPSRARPPLLRSLLVDLIDPSDGGQLRLLQTLNSRRCPEQSSVSE